MIQRLSRVGSVCGTSILYLICGFAAAAEQAQPQVYVGSIGKLPIVVEFDAGNPAQVSGQYFFKRLNRSQSFSGAMNGSKLLLKDASDTAMQDRTPNEWALHKDGKDGWQGEWQDNSGKPRPVSLQALQDGAFDAEEPVWKELYRESSYEYLRLHSLKFKAGPEQTFMGTHLQTLTDPVSKISFPQLTSGYTAEQRTRLNEKLRVQQFAEIDAYSRCLAEASHTMNSSVYATLVTPEWISPNIVSLRVDSTSTCIDKQTLTRHSALNLLVESGRTLTLEDVFWVGEGKPFHYAVDAQGNATAKSTVGGDVYSDYRAKKLVPWLVSQLNQRYADKIASVKADCDLTQAAAWRSSAWYFTNDGLAFVPACQTNVDWAVVPYSVIKQHPGGVSIKLPE